MINQIFVENREFLTHTPAFDAAVSFNSLTRSIQSATEMLPLKRMRVLHIVVVTAPPRLSYMRLADALVRYFGFRFTASYK